MLICWLIGSMAGCLLMGRISCQENIPDMSDVETRSDDPVQVGLTVNDGPDNVAYNQPNANGDGMNNVESPPTSSVLPTATPTAKIEAFSCYHCVNCTGKGNTNTRTCDEGIRLCYKIHKQIDKATQLVYRGCSISKTQCTVPEDLPLSFDTITCCPGHQCNDGKKLHSTWNLLIPLGLFILMMKF